MTREMMARHTSDTSMTGQQNNNPENNNNTMITNKQHNKQIEIDLTGPDGNAFTLMGQVKGWCKQMSIR